MRKKAGLPRNPVFGIFFLIALISNPGGTAQASDQPASRPNIILIYIDALRPDKLGCYGFPDQISPEIDALAAKGVRFKTVVVPAPWTMPSMAAAFTSQYPRTLGIFGEFNQCLNDRFVTLAEALKAAGYTTIGVTANPNLNSVFNINQGYDHYVDSNVVWEWMAAKPSEVQRSYTTKLKTSREIFELALDLLQKERRRPVFVFLFVMDVHEKKHFIPDPEFSRLFSNASPSEVRQYYRMVRQVSKEIGNFVQQVLARDDSRNTLFVISSDHGQGLFDHPHIQNSTEHGYLLYQTHLKVPLILFHESSSLKPRVVTRPVQSLDLMPTLLDYVGLKPPRGVAGHSLVPLIRGLEDQPDLPRYFVAETHFRASDKMAVYGAKWEYIENRDRQAHCDLYELQRNGRTQDGSLTNVISQFPQIARALKKFLDNWEKVHSKAKPTPCKDKEAMSKTLEQLKSLGYIR